MPTYDYRCVNGHPDFTVKTTMEEMQQSRPRCPVCNEWGARVYGFAVNRRERRRRRREGYVSAQSDLTGLDDEQRRDALGPGGIYVGPGGHGGVIRNNLYIGPGIGAYNAGQDTEISGIRAIGAHTGIETGQEASGQKYFDVEHDTERNDEDPL